MSLARRPYRQTARAAATEDTRRRAALAFHDLLLVRWMDEVTLDDVAAASGTTRQTIIRLFGGKEGLLEAMVELVWQEVAIRHAVPPDAPSRVAVRALVDHYEVTGDITIRLLAQEERHPALHAPLAEGRRGHRLWAAETFRSALQGLNGEERELQNTRLVVVTDIYVWKLLRRDLGYSAAQVTNLIDGMLNDIIRGSST
jgi:AcrR family transcriptional regulator